MLKTSDTQSGGDSAEPSTTAPPESTPLIQLHIGGGDGASGASENLPQNFRPEAPSQKRCADEQEHHSELLHKRRRRMSEMEKSPSAGFSRNDTNIIFEGERAGNGNFSSESNARGGDDGASTNYSDQITFCETKDGFEEGDLLTHEKKNSVLTDENGGEKVNQRQAILTSEKVNEENENENENENANNDVEGEGLHEEEVEGVEGGDVIDEYIHNIMVSNINKERMFNLLMAEKSEEKKVILRDVYSFFEQYNTLLKKEVCYSPEQVSMYQKVLKDRRRRKLIGKMHGIFHEKFHHFNAPADSLGEAINKAFFLSLSYVDYLLFLKGIKGELKTLDKTICILTCIFIAMNMENTFYCEHFKEFLKERGKFDGVLGAEYQILSELNFNLSVVTPMEFLRVLSYCDPDVDGQLCSTTSPFYTKEQFQEILFQVLNQGRPFDNENEKVEEEEEEEKKKEEDDDDEREEVEEKEKEKEKEEKIISRAKVPVEDVFSCAVVNTSYK